jgi:hypothetical protein
LTVRLILGFLMVDASFFGRPQRQSLQPFGAEMLSETGRHHGARRMDGPEDS